MSRQKRKNRLTNWTRERRGNIPRGTFLKSTCRLCGEEFTYILFARQRKLCNDCYASINLVQLEKMVHIDNQWNYRKWIQTLRAFGETCGYCGRKVKNFHRDHFIPKLLAVNRILETLFHLVQTVIYGNILSIQKIFFARKIFKCC